MLHPLTVFPSLLDYPFLAYFLLRLAVVWSISRIALIRKNKKYSGLAYLEFLSALFILMGLYTQIALIAGIVFIILDTIFNRKNGNMNPEERMIRWLTIIIAFCLIFLGPGAFALDYPL